MDKEIVTIDARNRVIVEYNQTNKSYSITEYHYNQEHDLWLPETGYIVKSEVFEAMLKINDWDDRS